MKSEKYKCNCKKCKCKKHDSFNLLLDLARESATKEWIFWIALEQGYSNKFSDTF